VIGGRGTETSQPPPELSRIASRAAPLFVAVLVFAISFGVLARTAGLPAWLIILMSAIVFSGSAQFAAIGTLVAGGSPLAAFFAASLLNLRYLALGAAVAPVLPGGRLRRMLLGQLVVDESYALGIGAGTAGRPEPTTMLVSGALLWLAWMLGTVAGALLGPVLGDPKRLGLDAAFPVAFLALLWPLLRSRRLVVAALGGALVALVLAPFTPPGIPLLGAAVAGLLLWR
jgi:4-azaleucine resistance transporter AzlC